MEHVAAPALAAGLGAVRQSPTEVGRVELIARRPAEAVRELLQEATLDLTHGVVGDTWSTRASRQTEDGSPHPDRQLTLMNARVAALVAQQPDRWALAGDQLYVDFDLSEANLAPGTRLSVGTAAIEITAEPHTGCRKFNERFGPAALRFVNSPEGRALRLRGVNAKVVEAGRVRVGDTVRKWT
jgi:MOSC domain-containing protein YiiM